MQAYIRFMDFLTDWIGKIFCWLMLPLVLITCIEVFMRYVVAQPTIWAWDVNIQIFAVIIFLSGGYALRHKGHITVDVLTINMSPRKTAILSLFTSIFFFFGITTLMILGWEMFLMSWKVSEKMPTIWAPPYYWMKLMIPLGCFLLLAQGVAEFFKDLLKVFSKAENSGGK